MNKDLFSLKGKVVIITGAAGLLGRRHADAVASFGGSPVLLDLNKESLIDLATKLNEKYDIELQAIDEKNILEVYFEDEIIYTTKDNFNNIKVNVTMGIEKIEDYLQNKNIEKINLNNKLDDFEIDEY